MIEVIDVVKRYGGVKVVDEVSLTIPKGKITSLIGPNGAGKSTLLSLISRLVPSRFWADTHRRNRTWGMG